MLLVTINRNIIQCHSLQNHIVMAHLFVCSIAIDNVVFCKTKAAYETKLSYDCIDLCSNNV